MTDRIVAARGVDTVAGLTAWFSSRGVPGAEIGLLPSPESTGYSHETIVFARNGERLIARVEPMGEHNVFPDPDLEVEYKLLDAISGRDVPLPQLHGFERDPSFLGAPFYVMEYLDGLVPPDSPPYCMGGWLYESTEKLRAQVWLSGLEAMARVHRIDTSELGFVNCGRPLGFDGEVQYWDAYAAFAGGDIAAPVKRAWEWIKSNRPPDMTTALCWGDSRLGNQMFRDGTCIGLLDWEMACLSDPRQDLGWFIYFDDVFASGLGVARLDGIPTKEETIARYEELTGTTVGNLDFFELFSGVRFALIMQRLFSLQMEMGKLPEDSLMPRDNFITVHLAKLCDEKGVP
ncbi:MAG TPA: phosphotransferase family protein [Actinomycetota bacterium]|jgi:aminoglycoside phosphotransferase (APT) family kinase protein|nr:phosphotransferase family protein [Actinomycetota bacterium]